MGFYSNDFANQGGNPDDLSSCSDKYKVTYPEFEAAPVKGANARPVFKWLAAQPNHAPHNNPEPNWNFNKYLISRTGELVAHWPSGTYPGDDPNNPNDTFDDNPIVQAIVAELGK